MTAKKAQETTNRASAIIRAVQRVIANYPNVMLAYLFGSQAQGNVGPMSDIDVALLLDVPDETGTIRSAVSASLAAAVGQVRVDIVFLNRVAVEFAYAIMADGKLIYQRDAGTRVEYEAKIMSLYCDYLPVLRAQRNDLLRGEDYETRVQRHRKALGRTERTLGALRSAEG